MISENDERRGEHQVDELTKKFTDEAEKIGKTKEAEVLEGLRDRDPETSTTASQSAEPPSSLTPRHVAIIMDGNGRWAAQRGWPRVLGHEHGTDNIRRITFAAGELGIDYLTLWAFSTENWKRPADEVDGIMRILGEAIERETIALLTSKAPGFATSAARWPRA